MPQNSTDNKSETVIFKFLFTSYLNKDMSVLSFDHILISGPICRKSTTKTSNLLKNLKILMLAPYTHTSYEMNSYLDQQTGPWIVYCS